MHLLISGGDSRLARTVVKALPSETQVRLIDREFTSTLPPSAEGREGDLRDVAFVAEALQGIDAVLHLAAIQPASDDPTEAIDFATRGTYVLATEALKADVARFVLGSSLALFDRLPPSWRVREYWRPRPEPTPEHLCPYLAELSIRECFRFGPLRPLCLRFGKIVDDAQATALPFDSRRVHIDDAVRGILSALTFDHDPKRPRNSNWIAHITAAGTGAKVRLGEPPFPYAPQHEFHQANATNNTLTESTPQVTPFPGSVANEVGKGAGGLGDWKQLLAPQKPIPSRPIRKVVIFGAGGPVAAEAARELAPSYVLRLTDLRHIEEIVTENRPQSPGSPLPPLLEAPHESRTVDVTDAASVMQACEGMDAILNCTVLRPDPVEAFRVNTLGAYHIVQAAAAHGIRRVIQTGPAQNLHQDEDGYSWDYEIPEALPRPGRHLYFHTKFLGQEICRVFAEYYDMEIPMLQYCQFLNPEVDKGLNSFAISWQDSARALRRAIEVRSYPIPYEVLNIAADLPHGKFSNQRAKEVLGWEPRDSVEHLWQE
jgi:nucleoside-diphosphate-sugar epimerase